MWVSQPTFHGTPFYFHQTERRKGHRTHPLLLMGHHPLPTPLIGILIELFRCAGPATIPASGERPVDAERRPVRAATRFEGRRDTKIRTSSIKKKEKKKWMRFHEIFQHKTEKMSIFADRCGSLANILVLSPSGPTGLRRIRTTASIWVTGDTMVLFKNQKMHRGHDLTWPRSPAKMNSPVRGCSLGGA